MVRISITKNNYVLSNVTSSFLVIKSIRIIRSYLSSLQDSTLSGILYHDFYKTTLFWPSFYLEDVSLLPWQRSSHLPTSEILVSTKVQTTLFSFSVMCQGNLTYAHGFNLPHIYWPPHLYFQTTPWSWAPLSYV